MHCITSAVSPRSWLTCTKPILFLIGQWTIKHESHPRRKNPHVNLLHCKSEKSLAPVGSTRPDIVNGQRTLRKCKARCLEFVTVKILTLRKLKLILNSKVSFGNYHFDLYPGTAEQLWDWGGGGMTEYWGDTIHFFLLTLYNFKNIGGARAPPAPYSMVSGISFVYLKVFCLDCASLPFPLPSLHLEHLQIPYDFS